MRYLVDTHIVLWSLFTPDRLSTVQQRIASSADNQKYISSISIWEISLKFGIGKLDLPGHTPESFLELAQQFGFVIAAPPMDCFASFHQLPAIPSHKDPFDRMLIWQAIYDDLTLLSSDQSFSEYKPAGLKLA